MAQFPFSAEVIHGSGKRRWEGKDNGGTGQGHAFLWRAGCAQVDPFCVLVLWVTRSFPLPSACSAIALLPIQGCQKVGGAPANQPASCLFPPHPPKEAHNCTDSSLVSNALSHPDSGERGLSHPHGCHRHHLRRCLSLQDRA